jgi:hypothetical protein
VDDTTLAIIAVFLIGFTLLVLGVQISRGDSERGADEEEASAESARRSRLSDMSPGEAPSTALPVNGEAALRRAVAAMRCDCGRPLEGVEPRWSEMVFAGRPLTSARWSCLACGSERTVYFEVRTPERAAG